MTANPLLEVRDLRIGFATDNGVARVLDGVNLSVGRGRIMGTLVGVLIVGVFRNGLQLIGVDAVYQILVTGILVILAVTVDQFARRRQR